MSEKKHTSYRLSDDAKSKLKDLADLTGLNYTEVLNNLIQAEHRYRRDDIDRMKAAKAEGTEK
jgi:predicted DNA-binding protein